MAHLLLDLEFLGIHYGPFDIVQCQFELQFLNRFYVKDDTNVGVIGCPSLLQHAGDLEIRGQRGSGQRWEGKYTHISK
jgi:hypothetical protein